MISQPESREREISRETERGSECDRVEASSGEFVATYVKNILPEYRMGQLSPVKKNKGGNCPP